MKRDSTRGIWRPTDCVRDARLNRRRERHDRIWTRLSADKRAQCGDENCLEMHDFIDVGSRKSEIGTASIFVDDVVATVASGMGFEKNALVWLVLHECGWHNGM